jgi:hypothetical protein
MGLNVPVLALEWYGPASARSSGPAARVIVCTHVGAVATTGDKPPIERLLIHRFGPFLLVARRGFAFHEPVDGTKCSVLALEWYVRALHSSGPGNRVHACGCRGNYTRQAANRAATHL